MKAFRDTSSLVLTGEFKHHDAMELIRRGIAAVHMGHWASERPVLRRVREYLRGALPGLRVDIARDDVSPYTPCEARAVTGG